MHVPNSVNAEIIKGFFYVQRKRWWKQIEKESPSQNRAWLGTWKVDRRPCSLPSETSRGLNSDVTSDQNYCTIQWLGTGCYSTDFCVGDVRYCNDSDSGFSALHVYMLSNVLLDCMNEHCLFVWFSSSLEKLL